MNKMKIVFVALIVLFLFSSSQAGLAKYALKGNKELSAIGSVAFFSQNFNGHKVADGTNIFLGVNLGFFVADKLELEPGIILINSTYNPVVGSSTTETHLGGIFALAYNFDTGSPAVPFIFGRIGFLTNSITDETDLKTSMILPDVGGGIKFFISSKAALRTEIYYNHMTNLLGEKDWNQNLFGLRAGLSVLF